MKGGAMRRWKLGIVAVVAAGAIGTSALPSSAVDVAKIRMKDNFFMPKRIRVEKGTRVKWVNRGSNPHTTTSTTGRWDSGTLSPGDAFARRFRKRGTFKYICSIHVGEGMRGKVVVV
jgi:plastocyanin